MTSGCWENPATVDVKQTHEKREEVRRKLAPLEARDKYLQQLAKLAVEEQELTETENYSVAWLSRPTKHVSLGNLARFIIDRNIAADVPIRLNKEIEAALGDIEDASGQPLLKIEEGQTSPSLKFKRKD